jgi:hypothetical protein
MIMSRIGSSSGVRVAAAPLSNVYTVMLLLAALLLVLVLTAVWVTDNQRYGVIIPVSDDGKTNMAQAQKVKDQQDAATRDLEQKAAALRNYGQTPTSTAGKAEAPAATPTADAAAPGATTPTATATPTAPAAAPTPTAPAPAPTGSAAPAAV